MWGWLHHDRIWGLSPSVSGSTEYVKRIKQLTVPLTIKIIMCICNAYRSFTELRRDHSLFSLSTPSADNDFLIFKGAADGVFHMWARQNRKDFGGQNYKLNAWLSICSTWDAASGLVQLWIDGKPSSRMFVSSGSNINGPIITVLGQVHCLHTIAT